MKVTNSRDEAVPVELLVCTTCRRGLPTDVEGPRPGASLHEALAAQGVPEGVTLLDDVEKVIVSIAQPRAVAEDEADEGDELLESAAAEPEVINQRGKDED